ncbi:MAG: glucoamylase family protein [Clostridia bacterium]
MQKNFGIPWGISEAAFSLKDLNNNYQYKAFGVPWLGLKRGLDEDVVVSSYSVFLSLIYDIEDSIKNIKILEKEGLLGKYGFYESVDYTLARLKPNEKKRVVKTYMAHHQGLILLSINNFINDKILVKRFHENPEIEAVDILLQERMPKKAIVTKEKKEKVEKLKVKDYENYKETVYTKLNTGLIRSNVISNGLYTVCTLADGQGYSKYKNLLINRYKKTADYRQGNFFYIRNLNNNQLISANLEEGETGKIVFAPDINKFIKTVGNFEIKTSNVVSTDEPIEIKRIEITNNGEKVETIEVINYFEPILSSPAQEYSHPAFNNLFLTYERLDTGEIIVKRKKRGTNEKNTFLGVNLYTQNQTIGDLEYEIDKEKFFGQGNIEIPEMLTQNKPFSNNSSQVTESILATKRIIKIEPKQKAVVDLILCVSENKDNVINMLGQYRNTNAISKVFELSRAKTEAESIYLGLKGNDIERYQKILTLLLFGNPTKSLENKMIPNKIYSQSDLWKFGISGDLPILLLKIKDVNEKYILKDILKAYEFFRSKNIKIELVILNKEINSYEHLLENEINSEIQNKQILYLKNTFGGIFVLNENEISADDINLLEFRANMVIDSSLGNIDLQLKDLEEEFISRRMIAKDCSGRALPLSVIDGNIETLNEDYSNLKYYNEFGGFSGDGLEYKFKVSKNNKLPTIWSMILANPKFGSLITQNLGGFTWYKNSRLNRVSAWNNTASQDIPSEIIYLENVDNGAKWCLSENISKNQEYHLTYGFGYVNLKTIKDNILQELTTFVPLQDTIKVNLLKLKNTLNEEKNLKLVYYIKPVLGEDEIKTSGYIKVEKKGNSVVAINLYKNDMKNEEVFITTNETIRKFTGDKKEFIGKANLKNPQKILNNDNGLYKENCIAIEIDVKLKPYETKEIVLNLGAKEIENNIPLEYNSIKKCEEELSKTKKYWYELLSKVHVSTPIESMNIMLNGWAAYQSITSRLWAKSGYYQSRRGNRI